jgi:predicted phosphodiesterase
MKIAVCSDIHNEFDIWKPKNPDKADVLILAGDIIVNQMLSDKSCINFFNQCAKKFKHVIYVMGNHEYYGADFLTALDLIKNKLSHLSNLYILNNQYMKLNDIIFFGTTLWTDCYKENPLYILEISQAMNDYQEIKMGENYFTVEDSIAEFKQAINFLRNNLWKFKKDKVVVITHHAPTYQSIPEKYRYDYALSSAYASSLDQFILDRPHIKYWIFGHTHTPQEFNVGDTVLLNNSRGYVGYERATDKVDPYLPKVFEL